MVSSPSSGSKRKARENEPPQGSLRKQVADRKVGRFNTAKEEDKDDVAERDALLWPRHLRPQADREALDEVFANEKAAVERAGAMGTTEERTPVPKAKKVVAPEATKDMGAFERLGKAIDSSFSLFGLFRPAAPVEAVESPSMAATLKSPGSKRKGSTQKGSANKGTPKLRSILKAPRSEGKSTPRVKPSPSVTSMLTNMSSSEECAARLRVEKGGCGVRILF
eukprot:CAMPEP_0180139954 /NCGR_PEP_ID=MMETSP0986-20121125/13886_1 /TAXON_ID=697907 /ORGANISM="non described non described, Strain CCMP2293" /LENGTH=222 /DNA_ID=CAMNT_0022082247 /DNA_START=15 /DNA_END=683 /DNA_ORIENTATION=-